MSTDRGVRFASFGLSSFQHFVWQEFVQSVTFSEDFDAVLSRFKSFFDDWNLLEYEELQIAEAGDDKHADRNEPDVMNKLDKRCAGIFLEPDSNLRVFGSTVFFHTVIHNFDENDAERDCCVIGGNAGHSGVEPEDLNKQETTWKKLLLPKNRSWGRQTLSHVSVSAGSQPFRPPSEAEHDSERSLQGEKVGQDFVEKGHLFSKAFDNQVAMSAHVNGDNRGERKVRSENNGSNSGEAQNRESHRPNGHDDSDDDEHAVVGDEAGTDEVDRRLRAEFRSFAECLPDAQRLFFELLLQA